MDPYLQQWRLYNHNIRNESLWSIKYYVYAVQHRHVTKKTTDSNYICYDCRGATVGDGGPWRGCLLKAVPNFLSMISMGWTRSYINMH
jgi:hypothetical protein